MHQFFVEQLEKTQKLGLKKSIYNLLYTRINLGESEI